MWVPVAVLSSTAEYPFEAVGVSLIARISSRGNYGHVHSSLLVLRIDYNSFSKYECHLDHPAM